MKIEIRKTRTDGIIQITTLDERFYAKEEDGVLRFNPSITWIEKYSPMGVGLLKYYAKHGWDEAKMLTEEAAERGSKVHQAIDLLLQGGKVEMDTKLADPDEPENESKYSPLTPDEYWSVMTFKDWWDDLNANHTVKVVDTEKTVWVEPEKGEKYGYAGTRDIKLEEKRLAFEIIANKKKQEIRKSVESNADADLEWKTTTEYENWRRQEEFLKNILEFGRIAKKEAEIRNQNGF